MRWENMATPVLPGDLQDKIAAFDVEFDAAAKAPEPKVEPTSTPAEAAPVETDTATTEPTSETASSEPSRSKDYQDLVSKYGGDLDAAAKAYWETNNRNSALAKELETVKATPAPTAEAPKETATVAPEEVQRFDVTLRAIKEENDKVRENHSKCLTRQDQVQFELDKLTQDLISGELELDAEIAAKKGIRAKQAELQRLYTLEDKFLSQHESLKERHAFNTTLKQQALVLSNLTTAREAEIRERAEASEDAHIRTFGVAFLAALPEVAKAGDKIPTESLEDWKEYAKQQSHLKLKVEDLRTDDIPQFLAETKGKFLAMLDRAHRAKSAEYAKGKLQDTTVNAPNGKAAVAGEVKKTGFTSQSEVDRFIENATASL